ncbi:MAG: DegT/DnrJ/EryC1/StrS family aminotransferase [Dokdonella sp.]|uniref:DegT/DnrJ/EryC1/StrS family aminotransferase n=1 Tax=Dokdonella sp. TaxID=2291710 RepID=UPI003F7D61DF
MTTAQRRIPFNALDRQNGGELGARMGDAACRIIGGGWYVLGVEVEAFEREFAAYCGASHAIGVANGSDALELAIASLGLPAGTEVAVAPNAAMYATLAILANGLVPLFVDVDPLRATLDPQALAAAITPRTRAVVATHLYGALADMDAIGKVARAHGLTMIEDCAQAHGASLGGRRAGSFGALACFSFYPTKNLGALGDGGAVTTSDDALAARVRQLRQYGWKEKYSVTAAHGRNSRLDELQAALLRLKLPLVDAWNARRRAIAARYGRGIRHPAIELPPLPGTDQVAHLYVVRSERRDALRGHLAACGIGVDIHYPIPDHRQPVFGERYATLSLPVAERLARTSLSLPCFAELEDAEVDAVIAACNGWDA